jgi:hypothetical protein
MPGPDTLTIAGTASEDGKLKVLLEGQGDTRFSVSPKGALQEIAPGVQFSGWVNMEGNWGPWVKVADKQNGAQSAPAASSQTGFPPPDPLALDATGRSIERQVAAKCAARILAGRAEPEAPDKYAERVHFLVDTFASAIRGN